MVAHPLCRECDGTGWIPYRSETLDGELEEAYRLCPNRCAPRRCMGFKTEPPCPRPDIMHCSLDCYCKEYAEIIRTDEEVDHAYEAIYYLSHWLRIARGRANEFLEIQLSEGLGKPRHR